MLEQIVRLTKSKVGFLVFVDEGGSMMTTHAWSRHVMEQCSVADKPLHLSVNEAGLWAETIGQRRSLIICDSWLLSQVRKAILRANYPCCGS